MYVRQLTNISIYKRDFLLWPTLCPKRKVLSKDRFHNSARERFPLEITCNRWPQSHLNRLQTLINSQNNQALYNIFNFQYLIIFNLKSLQFLHLSTMQDK